MDFVKLFDNQPNLVVITIATRLVQGLEQLQSVSIGTIHNFIGIVPMDTVDLVMRHRTR